MTADLLVLGAGPAGTGAALRAARAGHRVSLLEAGARVGGIAGSFDFAGMRVDLGSHRLHPSIAPEVLSELRGVLGDDLQVRGRNGRIRLGGRWLSFPLKAPDLARNLPRGFAARAGLDAATSWARRSRDDTFAAVLRTSLGPAMCERFYFPYARKLWGLEPEDISGHQARKRVTADTPWKLLRRALRARGSGGASGSSHFLYPRRGYGQISEALADAATAAGAELHLHARVVGIADGDDGVQVRLEDGRSFSGDALLSTIPLPLLARIMTPAAPPDVLAAAARLRSRAMVLVYLALAQDRYSSFDAHYLPEADTPVTRISEPKNYRAGDDPSGVTVLCAEIPCAAGDELWNADDDGAVAIARAALRAAELPDPEPLETKVVRVPSVYPVLNVGFETHLHKLEEWARSLPRVLTFGRQGLFVHDNAHHALAMAWAATDALQADGSIDTARWSAALTSFQSHVVED